MLLVPRQGTNTQHCVPLPRMAPTMNHLTRHDYASALQLLARVEAQSGNAEAFARAVLLALHEFVAAELTTLSVCDLGTGHCDVTGLPGTGQGAAEIACFERHGRAQPPIGPDYVLAVPLLHTPQTLVSVVLNRRSRDFDERDRERLDLLRLHLAFLYRHARKLAAAPAATAPPAAWPETPAPEIGGGGLTLRESQVMHWVGCGKTDAEVAALLSISPRTVQKHLEHVYVKLGVETRTAAAMRTHAGPSRA